MISTREVCWSNGNLAYKDSYMNGVRHGLQQGWNMKKNREYFFSCSKGFSHGINVVFFYAKDEVINRML